MLSISSSLTCEYENAIDIEKWKKKKKKKIRCRNYATRGMAAVTRHYTLCPFGQHFCPTPFVALLFNCSVCTLFGVFIVQLKKICLCVVVFVVVFANYRCVFSLLLLLHHLAAAAVLHIVIRLLLLLFSIYFNATGPNGIAWLCSLLVIDDACRQSLDLQYKYLLCSCVVVSIRCWMPSSKREWISSRFELNIL